ncbi:hypothetical protein [Actinorhabdospora filicis]|uniref:hypothetical protein n=1 Tax=Actinorhabdospora filicis TaxID=1785913 RepID=UPI002552AF2E|nr:hypothetical protein [Actinorhabdospora filicis]
MTPAGAGWWIFGLGAGGAVLGLMLARGNPGRGGRGLLAGLAFALATGLIVVAPDERLLSHVAYTPLVAVMTPFGGVHGLTVASAWPWPMVNMLVLGLIGLLFVGAAVAFLRRAREACLACGRSDRPGRVSAARVGRWASYLAFILPFGYAASRWCWALGIPLGVSDAWLAEMRATYPDVFAAGTYLATFAALGGVLCLGLTRRWGEVVPRWVPYLRGRRLPPGLAIIPATIVSLAFLSGGFAIVRDHLGKALSGAGSELGGAADLLWIVLPLWGVTLSTATIACRLRRRTTCATCGRGATAAA